MPKTDGSFDPTRYATVAERISLFYESHPTGRIETDLVNRDAASVTFKARVYRSEDDPVPAATGWATEREGDGDINTVACLENTETSAIGRALANLGFTASKQRPSVEEMRKADRVRRRVRACTTPPAASASASASSRADVVSVVAEESPDYGVDYAQAIADVLTLLGEAERAGLGADRVRRLRNGLDGSTPASTPMLPERLSEIERGLRRWLERNEPRVLE